MTRTSFFHNRWWVVFASVLGLIVGAGSINVFAFGVFLKPLSHDLHVGRGVISAAGGTTSIISAIASPFFGRMVDRWGVRPVLLPSIVVFAIAVACLAFLQDSAWALFTLFPLVGLTSVGQTPTAYSKAISAWFDENRGLALGIALAGVGLGVAIVPQFCEALLRSFGWRMAYVGVGAAIIVLAFIPVLLFVREPPPEAAPKAKAVAAVKPQGAAAGMTLREAIKSWRYWALTIAFFLGASAINGTLTHVVALLTDRGLSVAVAVGALSVSGLAMIFGRIFSGYCLDKIFGPYVAIVFFLCPLTGLILLYSGIGGGVPLIGTILLGFGIGAEFDLMAFFVGRYFGLRAFGTCYGFMFGVAQIGNAFGSNVMGWTYQFEHSYHSGFIFFVVALAVTCLLFVPLGPYPFGPQHNVTPAAPGGASRPQAT